MHKILVINSGSSSLKFQLLQMPTEEVIIQGLFDRIGLDGTQLRYTFKDQKVKLESNAKTHGDCVLELMDKFISENIIHDISEIEGVGHRVAHGGVLFKEATIITPEVESQIEELADLAPLHNPINLIGIKAFKEKLPHCIHVAVFDTAFHQTMEPLQYTYPISQKLAKQYGIRRYGFHGMSHQFISEEVMKRDISHRRVINCHLGNGSSLCAIKDGKSFNTSMGFTPTAGVMMGTRCGDIDPAILLYAMDKESLDKKGLESFINKEAGFLGVSMTSSDCRDIEDLVLEGHQGATLALNLFVKRICDTIGSYFVEMGGLDALVFTGGIGENSVKVRQMISEKLACLGVKFDSTANQNKQERISTEDSPIHVYVIPTNEEVIIARGVYSLLKV